MALAAIEFWTRFIIINPIHFEEEFKKKLFHRYILWFNVVYRILPSILEQVKIKKEDFQKFIRDKVEADMLDKNKEKVRMTIRSKAAKAIEVISGMITK